MGHDCDMKWYIIDIPSHKTVKYIEDNYEKDPKFIKNGQSETEIGLYPYQEKKKKKI